MGLMTASGQGVPSSSLPFGFLPVIVLLCSSGLVEWWVDGSSVMWLGTARQGIICPVLPEPCHCLSVLLCGCADELFPHNLKRVV